VDVAKVPLNQMIANEQGKVFGIVGLIRMDLDKFPFVSFDQ
jgi:hypothetical protein